MSFDHPWRWLIIIGRIDKRTSSWCTSIVQYATLQINNQLWWSKNDLLTFRRVLCEVNYWQSDYHCHYYVISISLNPLQYKDRCPSFGLLCLYKEYWDGYKLWPGKCHNQLQHYNLDSLEEVTPCKYYSWVVCQNDISTAISLNHRSMRHLLLNNPLLNWITYPTCFSIMLSTKWDSILVSETLKLFLENINGTSVISNLWLVLELI